MQTQMINRWRGLMPNIKWVTILVLALIALGLPLGVYAQGGDEGSAAQEITDDEVNAISRDLYCPVCENVPLDVCGTEACARWRAQVRTLLEDGASEEEVVDYFVDQFGDRVVGVPQDPTLNLVSWAVPAVFVVLGVVLGFVFYMQSRLQATRPAQVVDVAEEAGSDAAYRARLERELRDVE